MLPTSVAHVKRLEYDLDRDGLPISMEKAHRISQLLLLCTGTTIERGGRVRHGGLSTTSCASSQLLFASPMFRQFSCVCFC